MNLSDLIGQRKFLCLNFSGDTPRWHLCTSQGMTHADPSSQGGLPVLALLPDRFFFCHLPAELQGKNRRRLRQAEELRLRHIFPDPEPAQQTMILDTGRHILGCISSSELSTYIRDNLNLLTRCRAVTTPLILSLALQDIHGLSSWTLNNPGDSWIHVQQTGLEYLQFPGQQSNSAPGPDQSQAPELSLDKLLQCLSSRSGSWRSFNLPLQELEKGRQKSFFILKAAGVLLLSGLLFCAGDLFRLYRTGQTAENWQKRLESLYTRALGPDYGPDPYGLLLYQADQGPGRQTTGIDPLDLLAVLSRSAPESMQVRSLSLNLDSGTVTAGFESYQDMEKMLQQLSRAPKYNFTLEQADSRDNLVETVFSFTKEP